MIGLCDCNNFYVSCQRVFEPQYEGKPVIVLSGNDGCVIARSNEAKALGIKMGQPLFEIKPIVKQNNVKLYSTNFPLYGDMSSRVFEVLKESVPNIEIYSIDEAFLMLDGMELGGLKTYGENLVKRVRRSTGIPVSIGISHTKTLAKIASKLCKKYPKLKGACVMSRQEDITKVLSTFPIEYVWGIGRKYAKMLWGYGVESALDFVNLSEEWVRAKMGVVGLRTHKELRGERCIEFEDGVVGRQTIMVSRSFASEIYDFEELRRSVSTFVTTAAEKLRSQGSVAGALQVFVATNRHRTDQAQHSEGKMVHFSRATSSTLELAGVASTLLSELYREGYGYKKAGVLLSELQCASAVQGSLFDVVDRGKQSSAMEALDQINSSLGRGMVRVASSGELGVRSAHRSPSFSTELSDIIVVTGTSNKGTTQLH